MGAPTSLGGMRRDLARPSCQVILASALLAGALMDTVGFYGPGALGMVTAAALLALVAARRARRGALAGGARMEETAGPRALLATVVAVYLAYDLVKLGRSPVSLALLAAAVLLLAFEVRSRPDDPPRGARWRLALWMACAAVLLVRDIRARDGSFIDVWTFQQDASAALLRGEDPYSISYRNVYGDMRFYAPAVADDQRVHAYPYPPQTLLLDLPSFALGGDVRYAMLAGLLVAAGLMARLAPPGLGTLASAAVLFHPCSPRVIRSAWTESTVLPALLLLLLAIRRLAASPPRGWVGAGVAGALVAGAKQYAPLLLLPLVPALPRAGRRRTLATALGLAAAVVAPFALWDARGLWSGVVMMQIRQPARDDALSWSAALMQLGLRPLPVVACLGATAVALALTWPRRGSLAQGAACVAAAFMVFLVTAKQAFLNYYWLADVLLLAAGLLLLVEERPERSS